jgi:hypothetical protein
MHTKTALVAASLFFASASASAVEFHANIGGTGNLYVSNASGGTGFDPVAVTGYTGQGGQFSGSWASTQSDAFFRFFCVDLRQYATTGPVSYSSQVYAGANLDNIRKLYDVAYPNATAGDFWDGARTNFGVFANDVESAAFQVALWEIFLDNNLTLASGSSFAWTGGTTAVKLAADDLLARVVGYQGTGYQDWNVYHFVSGTNQDYMSATRGGNVPEPGPLALFGLGLAGLAVRRRRTS